MELKHLKELMAAMKKEGIRRLSIKEKSGFEITMERDELPPALGAAPLPSTAFAPPAVHHFYPHFSHPVRHDEIHARPSTHVLGEPSQGALDGPHREREPSKELSKEQERFITSPLVGTFYTAPSPDDPPFIKVGDRVEEGSVVCIIEAMKVMNEVKSGVSGVVSEILVSNADPVEFGTKIFRVK